jgi:enamine deaminase RidA (YjgF/YER057c/UK114 family)
MFEVLQPPEWKRPKGYANGIVARGRYVVIAGQIGWDADERFVSDDFVDQTRQALANVIAVLRQSGHGPETIVRMTWYVTDMAGYRARQAEIGAAYREVIGRHFPTMSLIGVAALAEPRAKVEIECTAVLPD